MALLPAWTLMSHDFDLSVVEFSRFISSKSKSISGPSDITYADECFLEGLLSRSWQSWGHFCRSLIVLSCTGAETSEGVVIPPHPLAHSSKLVSGAAIRAKQTSAEPTWGTEADALRKEVTWGDTDVLAKILPLMAVPRYSHLLAAFSQAHDSAKAMQVIRNASAHVNSESMANVINLSSKYTAFQISHPVHALFWTIPSSGDYLFRHALDELRDNASVAIA